jgi:hypothetical protein
MGLFNNVHQILASFDVMFDVNWLKGQAHCSPRLGLLQLRPIQEHLQP